MMFQSKHCYWVFVAVPLFISYAVGVTSLVIKAPELATKSSPYRSLGAASSKSLSSRTTLAMSNYDADYYVPTEQPAVGEQSRITLSRFLSQYVKDHPEVSKI